MPIDTPGKKRIRDTGFNKIILIRNRYTRAANLNILLFVSLNTPTLYTYVHTRYFLITLFRLQRLFVSWLNSNIYTVH
jgi:hypothetical protein